MSQTYHSSPQICLQCLRWHLHLALSSERMTDWLVRKQSFRPSGIFSVHKYYRKQLFVYPKTLHKKNIYARWIEFLFYYFLVSISLFSPKLFQFSCSKKSATCKAQHMKISSSINLLFLMSDVPTYPNKQSEINK